MTSASLPLPPSAPLSPGLSLPLSASLSLCSALFFFPLPFLSIPPLSDGVCQCRSAVCGLTHTERTPIPLPICTHSSGVSSPRVLHRCCCLAAPTPPPRAGVWESGPRGWRKSTSCFAGELCRISYALPRHLLTGRIPPFLPACNPEGSVG